MELDTNESGADQMEANANQETHVIKPKEAEIHTVDAETQPKNQELGYAQNTKGDIHNGEYGELFQTNQKLAAGNWQSCNVLRRNK